MNRKIRNTFDHKKEKREKRLAGKRKKSLKLFYKIVIALVCLSLISYFVYQSHIFSVTKLEITGNKILDDGQILKAVAPPKKSNFFDFPFKAVKKRVESLPWVEGVSVTRHFPGKITIEIKERKPFAYIQTNGILYVIDNNAYVVSAETFKKYKLPTIDFKLEKVAVGKKLKNDNVNNALKVFSKLPKNIKKDIYGISSPVEDELSFIIKGIEVIYGRAEDIDMKNDLIYKFLKRNKKEQISTVDLRVPKMPVVRVVGK